MKFHQLKPEVLNSLRASAERNPRLKPFVNSNILEIDLLLAECSYRMLVEYLEEIGYTTNVNTLRRYVCLARK